MHDADVPKDMLIYTQTSPDVTRVMSEIDALSDELTGGEHLEVWYDSGVSWPFQWYLRNYDNARFIGASLTQDPGNAPDAAARWRWRAIRNIWVTTPRLTTYCAGGSRKRPTGASRLRPRFPRVAAPGCPCRSAARTARYPELDLRHGRRREEYRQSASSLSSSHVSRSRLGDWANALPALCPERSAPLVQLYSLFAVALPPGKVSRGRSNCRYHSRTG